MEGERRELRSPALVALLVAVVLSGLMLAAGPAGASPASNEVSSGPLTARLGTGNWSFALRGGGRKPLLREQAGIGSTPVGRLGFQADGSWEHATEVKKFRDQGSSTILTLASTDPSRDIRVRVSPAGKGSIRLKAGIIGPAAGVESIGMAFRAPAGERYLGFGERSNQIDQRGSVVENWVGEGPYQADEYPAVSFFVPVWGMRQRPDATYFPIPWLLSTSGYGVLVENSEPSYFRLGTDRKDTWSVELSRTVDGLAQQPEDRPSPTSISLRFFAGPKPADVLRRFSGALGRQPEPAPDFFGPWLQSNLSDEDTVDLLRSADVPTSVYQTYLHYLPCASQKGQEQGQIDRTNFVHDSGMSVTTYFNPMICTKLANFGPLADAGALTMNRDGNPYEYGYINFDVGQFDFTSQVGRDAYGDLLREAISHGYDGWMEDFGEYAPPDAVSSNGAPGMVEHNPYARQYHCAASDETESHKRPLLRFVRSGYTGSAACSPIVWGGDPSSSWDFDGLRSAIQNGLTMGLSGVAYWGSDIGGYFSIHPGVALTPELNERWIQFGAFSGVMRNEADGFQLSTAHRPQVIDPDQITNWRRYSKLRTQLYPYVSAAATQYHRTGMPIMRAMALAYPSDRRAGGLEDEYMFGPDILVAPVVKPGETTRRLYLPRGNWIDFWRTFDYEEDSGAIDPGPARILKGGGWRSVPAPADEIPLMVRAGAMLTTLPPDVTTLSPFGKDDSVVGLDDRTERNLFAFPRGSSRGSFGKKGKVESKEARGRWSLKISDGTARSWKIRAATGAMKHPFRVACVKLNGRKLARNRWQASRGMVKVDPAGKRRRLDLTFSARRCG